MGELAYSVQRDAKEKKIFAWYTRLRQIEELYVKTLYALFVATADELPHVLSGEMPNSFSPLYDAVNRLVFEGRGLLREEQPGLTSGESFTPMEVLHHGAHASFVAMFTCLWWVQKPESQPQLDKYSQHVDCYYRYLDYMHKAFEAGKQKEEVLEGVKRLHRPLS